MTDVFSVAYAAQYDRLYRDKDYDAEVALIERAVVRHRPGARSVVDLGCGTGAHTIRLAARGFVALGVDRSMDMLAIARAKASSSETPAEFMAGDIRTIRLGRRFDVALMMFAVLGYQVTDADVRAALATARAHLHAGGLFIGDVWYGPAVLSTGPTERRKVIDTPEGQVVRTAHAALDDARHTAAVHYQLHRVSGGRDVILTEETHTMRYFFPQELALYLDDAGFEMVALHAAGDEHTPPGDATWNVGFVARAA